MQTNSPWKFLFCTLFTLSLSTWFAGAANAQQRPRLVVSPLQVAEGDPVTVRGTGFTPNGRVVSHLRRPDQSEYDVIWFVANDRGEYSQIIDTLLLATGTHELWAVDDAGNAMSNTARFGVDFEATAPPPPEVQQVLLPYTGVWRGNGARGRPPVPSTILIALTGGNTGAVGGTIAYPSLSCGGVLTFRAVYVDSIEFSETSTYGTERCVGNGIVTVKLAEDGSLSFQWRHPTLSGTTTGSLSTLKK